MLIQSQLFNSFKIEFIVDEITISEGPSYGALMLSNIRKIY